MAFTCMVYNTVYLHIFQVTTLPGQQPFVHDLVTTPKPEQLLPPQEGAGLLQLLVQVCVPRPHDSLHDPQTNELHPPSTTQ